MKRLASGTYRYALDDVTTPISEPWTLSRDGAGLRLQGERRRDDQALLRVDAAFEGTRCTRLDLTSLMGTPRTVHYTLQRKSLSWREGNDGGHISLPAGGLLFPLLRAATGPLVATLAQAPAFVVVPSLHDAESGRFLHPEVTPRRATLKGDRYEYYGGEYAADGCECWLEPHGLLARYVWKTPQGIWDVRLNELEVEPGFCFS